MSIRTRLILALLLLVAAGFCGLVYWIIGDLRPRYLAAMEESMVDMATVFASFIEQDLDGETIKVDRMREVLSGAQRENVDAQIYEELKTQLDMRVYVTDAHGIVIYDSDGGRAEGEDYLRWLDVGLTLKGEYGARTTPEVKGDQTTAVLYVGAPIKLNGKIVGVVTVSKKARSATRFLIWARKRIIATGLFSALVVALLGIVIYSWITIPIENLTQYAKAIRDGRRVGLPPLGRNEIGQLGIAFDEMRDALEGKEYISEYVQTLTHEMKSPLSAIRGAAELLDEEMPVEQRRQFLANIRGETGRMQDLIDRLLQLSALEKRKGLRDVETFDLGELATEVIESLHPVISGKNLRVTVEKDGPLALHGEKFLVRQALANLLQNAIDFSPTGGEIAVRVTGSNSMIEAAITDQGQGIPDFAMERIFDRFYSLPRPETGKKSSGLGLTIAREAAMLHGGSIRLENSPAGGAKATLTLPGMLPSP